MLSFLDGERGFVFQLLVKTTSLALSCRTKPGGNLQSTRRKPAHTDLCR